MLVAYVSTPRYEGHEMDPVIVEEDAKKLYKSGEKRIGTDEKTFIRIFSERSSPHLAAVSSAYYASFGNSLEKVIHNLETCKLQLLTCFLLLFIYSFCTI